MSSNPRIFKARALVCYWFSRRRGHRRSVAVVGRQFLLLKIPEEAAESAQFTVQGVVRHRPGEAQARAAQGQDEGRMGGEAFEDVPCETENAELSYENGR